MNELETAVKNNLKSPAAERQRIIEHHVIAAIIDYILPVPIIPLMDLLILVGIQINMVRKLALSYNVPFSRDRAKSIIGSFISSVFPASISGAFAYMARFIPLVGPTLSILSMPILAGASTYAMGKVFVLHFETGGNMLNLNPEAFKEYYREMFEEGKKVAGNLSKNHKSS